MGMLVSVGGGILVDVDNISTIVRTEEYRGGEKKIVNLYTLKQDKHLDNVKSFLSHELDADNELKYIMEAKGVIRPSESLVKEIEASIEEAKREQAD